MIDKEQISLNKKYWWDRHSCLSYCVPKEGFGNEGCWVFPLVTHPLMRNEILKKDYEEAFPIRRWGTSGSLVTHLPACPGLSGMRNADRKEERKYKS